VNVSSKAGRVAMCGVLKRTCRTNHLRQNCSVVSPSSGPGSSWCSNHGGNLLLLPRR